jgi:hypothetical protein
MSTICNQVSHQVFIVDHVQQPLLQTLVHPMTGTHGHPGLLERLTARRPGVKRIAKSARLRYECAHRDGRRYRITGRL